jgi:DNA-binding beta-propeller fold protein YncE
MRKIFYTLVVFVFLIAFSFCKKDKGLSNYGNYPNDIGTIMVTQCATSGCHDNISYIAASGLNLSTWDNLFKGSKSGSSVIPFSSKFSSLCYFINRFEEIGPVNYPTMPLNKDKLSKEEVLLIQNWIDAGAPDINGNIKWADNPNRKKMYVTNQACDVVTVFDSETQLPMRYVEVGIDPNTIEVPHMIKVSPDGQYWYVVFTNANIFQKFRCSDDKLVATTSLGANFDWNTCIISDDGTRAYCVAWSSNGHIASVDLTQMKLIKNYGGFAYPHGVGLNANNDIVYMTAQSGNFIFKLDTGFNTVQQISLDGLPPSSSASLNPHEFLISDNKQDFYITCSKSNELRVFNIASETVTQIIPTGATPLEMSLAKNANKLFVTCMKDTVGGANGSVEVINTVNFSHQNIKIGALPHGLAVDENKNILYVASRNIYSNGPAPHHTSVCGNRNGFVNFIEINTLQVKAKKTELAADPYSAAYRK